MYPLVIRTSGSLLSCLAWVNNLRLNFNCINLLPGSTADCAQRRLPQASGSQGAWALGGNSNDAGAKRLVSGWANLLFPVVHLLLNPETGISGMGLGSFSFVPLIHSAQMSDCAEVLC